MSTTPVLKFNCWACDAPFELPVEQHREICGLTEYPPPITCTCGAEYDVEVTVTMTAPSRKEGS